MTRRATPEPDRGQLADLAARLLCIGDELPVLQTVLAVVALGGLEQPVPVATLLNFTPLLDQFQDGQQDARIRQSIEMALGAGVLSITKDESGSDMLTPVFGATDRERLAGNTRANASSFNDVPRPNAFERYEQHIGLITPIIADKIGQALQLYPDGWVEDAIDEASAYNRRNWRYVETILENWSTEGRSRETHQRNHEEHLDPGKYLHGRYAPYFRKR